MDAVIALWKREFETHALRVDVGAKESNKRQAWKAQLMQSYGKVQLAILFVKRPLCKLTKDDNILASSGNPLLAHTWVFWSATRHLTQFQKNLVHVQSSE